MTTDTTGNRAAIAAVAGITLVHGCATNPSFPTATDSHYRILAREQLYHGDSVMVQGAWVAVEAWPTASNQRPASLQGKRTIWIPRDAITSIETVPMRQ